MTDDGYRKLLELETTPEALEAAVQYLARRMQPFLQPVEPVLICFPDEGPKSLGGIFTAAVRRCEGDPVAFGPDFRWKTLLRAAFQSHASTLIGPPAVILGLMKLARATATPLYIYDVIACGDPFAHWMAESMKKGLDCRIWGCYAVRSGPVIAGFSCEQEAGIHIREDVLIPDVQSQTGEASYGVKRGNLSFVSAKDPGVIFDPRENAVVFYNSCSCGRDEPRVVDAVSSRKDDLSRILVEDQFLAWSSILDYRARLTEYGIDLELVVFPGESLPKIPSCAKLTVRPWDPERDIPFYINDNFLKIPEKFWQ